MILASGRRLDVVDLQQLRDWVDCFHTRIFDDSEFGEEMPVSFTIGDIGDLRAVDLLTQLLDHLIDQERDTA